MKLKTKRVACVLQLKQCPESIRLSRLFQQYIPAPICPDPTVGSIPATQGKYLLTREWCILPGVRHLTFVAEEGSLHLSAVD